MNIFITHHAVERYRERVDPTQSVVAAMRRLIKLSKTAKKLPVRTKNGHEQWVADDTVFICKVDPDGSHIAVTVGRYEEDDSLDRIAADAELDRQYWAAQRAAEAPQAAPTPVLSAGLLVEVEVLKVAMAQRKKVILERLKHGAKETDKAITQLRKRQVKDETKLRGLLGQPQKSSPTLLPA